MKRDPFIDFLKGILIFAVIFGHVIQFLLFPQGGYFGDPLFKGIYAWHMPLFMAVSGYLSWRSIVRERLADLLVLRIRSYVVPMATWPSLFYIGKWLASHSSTVKTLPVDLGLGFLYDFWFIWALLFATIGTALLVAWNKRPEILLLLFVAAVELVPDFWLIKYFKYTLPYFVFGCLASKHDVVRKFRRYCIPTSAVSLLIFGLCYVAWNEETYVYTSGGNLLSVKTFDLVVRFSAGLFGSIGAVGLFWSIFRYCPPRLSAVFEVVGRDSIYVYLIQGYLFVVIARLMQGVAVSWHGGTLPYVAALFVAAGICASLWWIASVLAANRFMAMMLFGRWKRSQMSGPVTLTNGMPLNGTVAQNYAASSSSP